MTVRNDTVCGHANERPPTTAARIELSIRAARIALTELGMATSGHAAQAGTRRLAGERVVHRRVGHGKHDVAITWPPLGQLREAVAAAHWDRPAGAPPTQTRHRARAEHTPAARHSSVACSPVVKRCAGRLARASCRHMSSGANTALEERSADRPGARPVRACRTTSAVAAGRRSSARSPVTDAP
jgi:hypothetical protein